MHGVERKKFSHQNYSAHVLILGTALIFQLIRGIFFVKTLWRYTIFVDTILGIAHRFAFDLRLRRIVVSNETPLPPFSRLKGKFKTTIVEIFGKEQNVLMILCMVERKFSVKLTSIRVTVSEKTVSNAHRWCKAHVIFPVNLPERINWSIKAVANFVFSRNTTCNL